MAASSSYFKSFLSSIANFDRNKTTQFGELEDDPVFDIIPPKRKEVMIVIDDDLDNKLEDFVEKKKPKKKKKKEEIEEEQPRLTASEKKQLRSTMRAPVDRSSMHFAKRIGGSDIGTVCGMNKYSKPSELYFSKLESAGVSAFTFSQPRREKSPIFEEACAHGQAYEEKSITCFRTWLQNSQPEFVFEKMKSEFLPGHRPDLCEINRWKVQRMEHNIEYRMPVPSVHTFFTGQTDAAHFGATCDMEGSMIDCEIKNPLTYMSFFYNYLNQIQPQYFAQCQWQMAVRERDSMFFVVTSFDKVTNIQLGCVIWYVIFNKAFFQDILYPTAKKFISALERRIGDEDTVDDLFPHINKDGEYSNSEAYRIIHNTYCKRVFCYKNSAELRRIIQERKAKERQKSK
jgi:hypothetical protein